MFRNSRVAKVAVPFKFSKGLEVHILPNVSVYALFIQCTKNTGSNNNLCMRQQIRDTQVDCR